MISQQTESGYSPATEQIIESFIAGGRDSIRLEHATMRAVRRGHQYAFLMPVIDMAIKAALAECNAPDIRPNMPAEVCERAQFAGSIAAEILLKPYKNDNGWIASRYCSSPILSAGMTDRTLRSLLVDTDPLISLTFAPFSDWSYLAGGAKGRLDIDGITIDQACIVSDSPSLLLFAQIDAECTREDAEAYLGWPPYVHHDALIVNQKSEHTPTVAFTHDAEMWLRGLISDDGGCPAANIGLLHESWRNMSNCLLIDGATVTR